MVIEHIVQSARVALFLDDGAGDLAARGVFVDQHLDPADEARHLAAIAIHASHHLAAGAIAEGNGIACRAGDTAGTHRQGLVEHTVAQATAIAAAGLIAVGVIAIRHAAGTGDRMRAGDATAGVLCVRIAADILLARNIAGVCCSSSIA